MRLFVIALLIATAAEAQQSVKPIQFAPGRSTIGLPGSIVRGEAALYSFDAREGQQADIRVRSVENNASFVVYLPPADVGLVADQLEVKGSKLAGGDKTSPPLDAGAQKHWRGTLPATGRYYIEVAPDRGSASYELTVKIK